MPEKGACFHQDATLTPTSSVLSHSLVDVRTCRILTTISPLSSRATWWHPLTIGDIWSHSLTPGQGGSRASFSCGPLASSGLHYFFCARPASGGPHLAARYAPRARARRSPTDGNTFSRDASCSRTSTHDNVFLWDAINKFLREAR